MLSQQFLRQFLCSDFIIVNMWSRLIFFLLIPVLNFSMPFRGMMSSALYTNSTLLRATETSLPVMPIAAPSSVLLAPFSPSSASLQIPSLTPTSQISQTITASEDFRSDHLLPDLQTLPPVDLRLLHDTNSGRTLIRFTNSIWNSGPGKLELIGIPNKAKDQIQVTQRVYTSDPENYIEFEVGEFKFHDQHDHWHLEQFALYEVWSIDEMGSLETVVSSGGKVSYCVMDVSPAETALSEGAVSPYRSYIHCQGTRQGLSVGWIDTYKYFYPGQWVEVTSLEDGIYALVSTVDPDHLLQEENTHNNSAVAYFEIRNLRLKRVDYLFIEEEGVQKPQ